MVAAHAEGGLFRLEAVEYLIAQELSDRFVSPQETSEQASLEAFVGLSELLSGHPAPETFDGLAHAARLMARSEASWLLIKKDEEWIVVGRSLSPEAHAMSFTPESGVRIVPLAFEGRPIGALAFWPEQGGHPDTTVEEAFEHALAAALQSQEALQESLRLSSTDGLTGLPNRRTLEAALPRQVALAHRGKRPLSVLMLDLDHFKRVNDHHGHEAGDQVLKVFADTLVKTLRASDMPARYGGEEFVVVLPDTALPEATAVAEKVRAAVEQISISSEGEPIRPTVSIGVASLQPKERAEALVARADAALYRAKRGGRNRCHASDVVLEPGNTPRRLKVAKSQESEQPT